MPLPTTGPISLQNIATELGGTAPHSLSEYYGASSGVPASGTVGMSAFYGASGSYSYTLSSNTKEGNIRSIVLANGWDGSSGVEFVIGSGVYCWSDNTAVAGLSTGGPFPGGLTIVNKGYIMGRGGDANSTSTSNNDLANTILPGSAGGPALDLSVPVTIDNTNGYIGGGGGGGGGVLAGGGAGGGKCPGSHTYDSAVGNDTTTATYTAGGNNTTVPLGGTGTHIHGPNYYESHVVFIAPNDGIFTPSGGGGNSGVDSTLILYL